MAFTKKRVKNGYYNVYDSNGQKVATITKNVMFGVQPWIWELALGYRWSDQLDMKISALTRPSSGSHDTLQNAFEAVTTRIEVRGITCVL